jgi:hypothetical protein
MRLLLDRCRSAHFQGYGGVLVARTVLALAAAVIVLASSAAARAGEARPETTASAGAGRSDRAASDRAALALTEEQRDRIFYHLMQFPEVRGNGRLPGLSERLSREQALEDLPTSILREIPRLHAHKFLKLEDRILLVDPGTRVVVAMIPRYKLVE